MNRTKSAALQTGLMIAACLAMALVETLWKPGYVLKSLCKFPLFAGIPLLFAAMGPGRSVKTYFSGWKRGLRLGLPLGGGVFLFLLGAYALLGPYFDFSAVTGVLEADAGVTGKNFWMVSLYISFVNSFLEEFFFRGFGFLSLGETLGQKGACLFSALLFALYHVAIMASWFSLGLFLLLTAGLAAAGLLFNWLDSRTDSLYPSWFVHICANLAINFIGFLLFGLL